MCVCVRACVYIYNIFKPAVHNVQLSLSTP